MPRYVASYSTLQTLLPSMTMHRTTSHGTADSWPHFFFLFFTPYGNEKPKLFVLGAGEVVGVLAGVLPPLPPVAAPKGLKEDVV
jgi:hypothetical protein